MNKKARKDVTVVNVRGRYLNLLEANDNDKYQMQLIIPKDHDQMGALREAIANVSKEAFGESVNLKTLAKPLRDADKETEELGKNHGEAAEGCMIMNARNGRQPKIVVGEGGKRRLATEAELKALCYDGAYFHVSVTFFPYDTEGNRGIGAGLNSVMLYKAGDPLGASGPSVDEAFGAVEETKTLELAADDLETDDDW